MAALAHLSLSTWLRSYLYIPLGGNRHGLAKRYRNLMLTMLLGGLWHGASWNFVLWGGLHGAGLCAHKAYQWALARLRSAARLGTANPFRWRAGTVLLAWGITQGFTLLCWVPFRAESFGDTAEVLLAFVGWREDAGLKSPTPPYALLLLPILADTFIVGGRWIESRLWRLPAWGYAAVLGVVLALLLTMVRIETQPFIYFQF